MIFVTLCKAKSGTQVERTARRLDYQYPEGMRVLGEWWLQTPDPEVVLVTEADGPAAMLAARSAWDDFFDITIFPAVAAEEGMAIARQAMAK